MSAVLWYFRSGVEMPARHSIQRLFLHIQWKIRMQNNTNKGTCKLNLLTIRINKIQSCFSDLQYFCDISKREVEYYELSLSLTLHSF